MKFEISKTILFASTGQGVRMKENLQQAIYSLRKVEVVLKENFHAISDESLKSVFDEFNTINKIMFRISTINEESN